MITRAFSSSERPHPRDVMGVSRVALDFSYKNALLELHDAYHEERWTEFPSIWEIIKAGKTALTDPDYDQLMLLRLSVIWKRLF